jgi:preprotein translocase subunit SecD
VLDLVVVFLVTHPLMAVLSRVKGFGSNRFSGLGSVDRSATPAGSGRAADRRLVGATASGATAAGARNRSTP